MACRDPFIVIVARLTGLLWPVSRLKAVTSSVLPHTCGVLDGLTFDGREKAGSAGAELEETRV